MLTGFWAPIHFVPVVRNCLPAVTQLHAILPVGRELERPQGLVPPILHAKNHSDSLVESDY